MLATSSAGVDTTAASACTPPTPLMRTYIGRVEHRPVLRQAKYLSTLRPRHVCPQPDASHFAHWPSQAALDRYGTIDDRRGQMIDYRLPDDPGPVHAHVTPSQPKITNRPVFLTDPPAATGCGAPGKVLLPVAFDPGDPNVCQTCAALDYRRTNGDLSYTEWRAAGESQRRAREERRHSMGRWDYDERM